MAVTTNGQGRVRNIQEKYLPSRRERNRVRNADRIDLDRGSISILTIGLFLVTVMTLFLITDVASIIVSKRSLVHLTEAAALSAAHQLDLGAYYQGKTNVAIPIDCERALSKISDELGLWVTAPSELKRVELGKVEITEYSCEGNRISLATVSTAILPFRIPGSITSNVEIHATVAAQSDSRS